MSLVERYMPIIETLGSLKLSPWQGFGYDFECGDSAYAKEIWDGLDSYFETNLCPTGILVSKRGDFRFGSRKISTPMVGSCCPTIVSLGHPPTAASFQGAVTGT